MATARVKKRFELAPEVKLNLKTNSMHTLYETRPPLLCEGSLLYDPTRANVSNNLVHNVQFITWQQNIKIINRRVSSARGAAACTFERLVTINCCTARTAPNIDPECLGGA